ncbi:hypothetical protein SPI_04875 [Niveomyces insectorum RCEF 264]|uniref:HNH nuclease domain-containing protein n=1 Tax=Niveomyces insectorum RCEF 264 TaxID=1081102 RepID=A0A167UXU6_9HYPO|nr:hypothetical protein SPI_04875 [Niveomyces insectorum RCEF 264]
MASPTPHHRHQASLESINDPAQPVRLSPAQRANARRILYQIVEFFEALDDVRSSRRSRFEQYGDDARDDDGILFEDDLQLGSLEVAHILPHALLQRSQNSELDASRQAALAILNMFDLGVAHTINGVDVDRPRNALTLTADLHGLFGGFKVYFDPVPGAYNTYRIQSFLPPRMNRFHGIPMQRALFVTQTHTIDPPSPRLLAVHRAVGHILHLSAAGEYIDAILRDLEYGIVRADGSSELGQMVSLVLRDGAAGAVSY